MLSLRRGGSSRQRKFGRRELLRVGGLSLLGLNWGQLSQLRALAADKPRLAGRHGNSCVFLFLFGGPSQIDLWDMKPNASREIRGDFDPISTTVPGIQVCEHLPRLAQQMDKLCLLRSMTHGMNVHGPACSEIFTGREYFQAPTTDQADPLDWPSLSALAMRYAASRDGLPPSIVLPWYLQFPGQSRRIAGQTGGRMGERHNALLVSGDSRKLGFRTEGFELQQNVPLERIEQRRDLLRSLQIRGTTRKLAAAPIDDYGHHGEDAYELLQSRAGELFDLRRESEQTRSRYGRSMVGQSLLMARRLVEAGVPLVTVNWEDETKTDGVNTCWDTHQNNFTKLKEHLCPLLDQSFPTFLADLHDRGLLETTLVVAVGEFGRTPHLGQFSQSANTQKTGRDHWPSAFTALLAGGGVRGGQVYGATDHHAAQVKDKPVSPADLTATILEHLGVDPTHEYVDEFQNLPHKLSIGTTIATL